VVIGGNLVGLGMRKKPVWRRYAFYLILGICHPAALVLLWYWLPVIALLEDPIFRDDGAAYGEEERIPPSVHTELDDMQRELRRRWNSIRSPAAPPP
jgi:hypothetical protein